MHGPPDRHGVRSLQGEAGTTRRGGGDPDVPDRLGRAGGTLIEVMIALLVMGIGVVSAATMFPIAVLRTIQATQLTRATVLRFNAEVQLDLHPQLIDRTRIPRPSDRPVPPDNIPTAPGSIRTAVVDPLGYYLVGDTNSVLRTVFGDTNDVRGNQIVDPNGAAAPLLRVNVSSIPNFLGLAGMPTTPAVIRSAEQLVTLPDSWREQVNDIVTSVNLPAPPALPSVTLSSAIPAGIPTAGGQSRITLFHSSGRKSIVRVVTGISDSDGDMILDTVSWAAMPALPAEYTATTIERAVIETRNRQFTWMLTVRKDDSGVANINVAVFFNRAHEPVEEAVFPTIPGLNGLQIDVDLSPPPLPAGVSRPLLRRGSYLLDPVNARWYRITKVTGEQTNRPTITLDRTALEPIRYAIFLPRVVDVFSINTRVVP